MMITSILLGALYNMLAHKCINIMYSHLEYDKRLKQSLVTLFIVGVMTLIISKFILHEINTCTKDGLFIGGCFLIVSAIANNWDHMNEQIKILLLIVLIGTIIYYTQKINDDNVTEEKID